MELRSSDVFFSFRVGSDDNAMYVYMTNDRESYNSDLGEYWERTVYILIKGFKVDFLCRFLSRFSMNSNLNVLEEDISIRIKTLASGMRLENQTSNKTRVKCFYFL